MIFNNMSTVSSSSASTDANCWKYVYTSHMLALGTETVDSTVKKNFRVPRLCNDERKRGYIKHKTLYQRG